MTTEEFEKQLGILGSEAHDAERCFYVLEALYEQAFDGDSVAHLNRAPTFWNATLDALLASLLMTMSRVFDPNPSNYQISRLVGLAQKNPSLFHRSALRRRLLGMGVYAPTRIEMMVQKAFEPSEADFIRLRKAVSARREVYEQEFSRIRHSLYAHRIVEDRSSLLGISPDIERHSVANVVAFVAELHTALSRLYFEGKEPHWGALDPSPAADVHTAGDRNPSFNQKIKQEVEQLFTDLDRAGRT